MENPFDNPERKSFRKIIKKSALGSENVEIGGKYKENKHFLIAFLR